MCKFMIALVPLLLTSQISFGEESGDPLEVSLVALSREADNRETPAEQLKEKYLLLTGQYGEPEQLGRIYTALADMLCQTAFLDHDAAVSYAEKALEYPIEPIAQMKLYCDLGGLAYREYASGDGPKNTKTRRDVAFFFLNSIRISMEEDTPDEVQEYLDVGPVRGSGLEYERMKRENERLMKQVIASRAVNDMIFQRSVAESQLSSIYCEVPQGEQELREVALEQLRDEASVNRTVEALRDFLGAVPAVTRQLYTTSEPEKTTNEFTDDGNSEPKDTLDKDDGPIFGGTQWRVTLLLVFILFIVIGSWRVSRKS